MQGNVHISSLEGQIGETNLRINTERHEEKVDTALAKP